MKVRSLASGSQGNSTVVEADGQAILIDCGIPYKLLKGIEVSAVLVTHSHCDHVKGLATLVKRRHIPVYANMMTAETILSDDRKLTETDFICFENGQPFEIGPFRVHPFSIPHDTADPVGYLVSAANVTYFHGTDIGTPLDSIGLKLAEADLATLESNHDPVLLRTSGRPASLIQRIAGPRGHLSNDDACNLVRRFASPRLTCLSLAHLSGECNTPCLAEGAMRETLASLGRTDIDLQVLSQDQPGRTMEK